MATAASSWQMEALGPVRCMDGPVQTTVLNQALRECPGVLPPCPVKRAQLVGGRRVRSVPGWLAPGWRLPGLVSAVLGKREFKCPHPVWHSLFIHQLMDISVVSISWGLWVMLLRIFSYALSCGCVFNSLGYILSSGIPRSYVKS